MSDVNVLTQTENTEIGLLEVEVPALKDPGVLFKPFPKQIEFLDAVFSGKYRVVLYGGAIRGGKTFAGLGAALLLCKFYPGSIWAIVRETLPSLKQTVIKSFKKICPVKFITSYNQETQTVTFTNKSQIIFWSENYEDDKELDRWKGLEVSGFVLEECNELQEDSFWKAIERAGSYIPREGNKPPPIVMATCNPSNNWVKKLIYDPSQPGYVLPEGKKPMPATWLYIPSKITDNPYAMADKEYIDSINTMPEYKRQVFVEGNWDIQLKVGGEYFKCFEIDKHVGKQKDVEYNPALPLHISWDDNVNPYLPTGIFQIEIIHALMGNKTLSYYTIKMIDEITGINPRNTIKDNCNELIRRYPYHTAGMFTYGDATAQKEDTKLEKGFNFYRLIQDYLKQYKPGLKVMSVNPAVFMRANWMNSIFEKQVGNIKIIISDKCKTAINDFIILKEDENGGKAKVMETDPQTKVRSQKVGHFADLLEYFMVSAFAGQFALYQAGGAISSITYGRNPHDKNSYK